MKARVGDRLVRDSGGTHRVCEIIGLHHADGSPPYVVRWLTDGHIALLYPGPYMRLVHREDGPPAGQAAGGTPARETPTRETPAGAGKAGTARPPGQPRPWPPAPFLARTLLRPRPHGAG